MRTHLVLTPDRDKEGRNDYTGAFKPESERYATYWRAQGDTVHVHRIDVSEGRTARAAAMLAHIEARAPIDALVLLCHGWEKGVQFGLSIEDSKGSAALMTFAERLARASNPPLYVVLYCCLTGASDEGPQGDGGFADQLRDALCAAGRPDVHIFAHTTAGHTTRNARIRLFRGDGSATGGTGGVDPVARGTTAFRRLDERLHDKGDPLRWQIPFLTPDAIVAELA
jgi:hypothetical protein